MSFFWVGHFEFFFSKKKFFFCFIPMKISPNLYGRMDGSKFWCFPWFPENSLLCVILRYTVYVTGKSLSEALIFASTNPHTIWRQIVHCITTSIHETSKLKPGENMLCTEIVSDIQNNFCTQHVLPMFCKKKSFWQRFTCTYLSTCFSLSHSHFLALLTQKTAIMKDKNKYLSKFGFKIITHSWHPNHQIFFDQILFPFFSTPENQF